MEDRLLKIKDALQIIPISKSAFWERVKGGTLPKPVKIGASTFWKYSDLMVFIANMPVSECEAQRTVNEAA
jgi:prophage regulatory protein